MDKELCQGGPFCEGEVEDTITFSNGKSLRVCGNCMTTVDAVLNAIEDGTISWTWASEKEEEVE